jgi:hypothetical protein
MSAITQIQFPPVKKLRAFATGKISRSDLAVFEFLKQLSVAWDALWDKSDEWDKVKSVKSKRLFLKGTREECRKVGILSVEKENKTRFFELACIWIRRNLPDYFPRLLVMAEILSALEIPEPEATTVSLLLPSVRNEPLPHHVLIRSWPAQGAFIAQQKGRFKESDTLAYNVLETDYDDLDTHHVNEVHEVIRSSSKKFGNYTGFWRKPLRGDNSKYGESWMSLGETLEDHPVKRHNGSAVLDLFSLLVDRQSLKAVGDLQEFLQNTPDDDGRVALYDWACQEDGRVVI